MALDLTKSSTAYIVKGGTGEYDDRTDWYVYATTSKPEALALHAASKSGVRITAARARYPSRR